MCTGRIDLAFILRAFRKRADGVIIGGCWPGECHYVTEGNYDALGNMLLGKRLLRHIGVDPRRLRLEWIAASEGTRFAEIMTEFVGEVRELGPLGQEIGNGAEDLAERIDALNRLVPYLKLVEREKLRVPARSEEAYREFYQSAEMDRLFNDLIADKLVVSRILSLLARRPRTTGEISQHLGMNPSDVSRHMNASSRQGLVRFDMEEKRYALA